MTAAQELKQWSDSLLRGARELVWDDSRALAENEAAVSAALERNAAEVVNLETAAPESLYSPLCLVLAFSCMKLGITPGVDNWSSAIANVASLSERIADAKALGLPGGCASNVLKEQLDLDLAAAGVVPERDCLPDEADRAVALARVSAVCLRLVVSMAMDKAPSQTPGGVRGLGWMRRVLDQPAA